MFNFASKVINTLGDLINVEEPPKPAANQQSQAQNRNSGDDPFFQQPKARFHGPTSLSDHNAFRQQTSSLRNPLPPRSSAPVYRYPSTSSSVNHQQGPTAPNYSTKASPSYNLSGTTSYGQPSDSNYSTPGTNQYRTAGRYEDEYKPPDVDYNKDSYSTNSNYDSPNGSFLNSDVRGAYDDFEDRRIDERDLSLLEEDRFSSPYEGSIDKKFGNRKSNQRDSPKMIRNTNECTEKNSVIYSNSPNPNYQIDDSWSNNVNSEILSYDDMQNNSPRNMVINPISDPQFADPTDLNLWREDYCSSQGWKTDENNAFEIKDDKISPSPPSQDELDAKNSSRSGSESSDEISFGEALATGLVPPNITPEIAARMNIELINHPKAVIESIYGHSPGEVYTIPEEEDEIYSPTGADGVTSLRKQRMASARMETSGVLMLKELQNQQKRIAQNHQQQYDSGNRLNYKYEAAMDLKREQTQQYNISDAKLLKQVPMQRYPNAPVQVDHVMGQSQPFHHQLPQIPYESNMSYQQHRSPESKAQQDRQQSQKISRSDNKQTNYVVDSRHPNQMNSQQFYNNQRVLQNQYKGNPQLQITQHGQMNMVDGPPKQPSSIQSESQSLAHEQANRNQSYQTSFPPNTSLNVTSQGYDDNRILPSVSYCDNRLPQPVQFSDNRQIMFHDSRPVQRGQNINLQKHSSELPQQQVQQQQQQQQQLQTQSYYNTPLQQQQQQYQEQYQQQQPQALQTQQYHQQLLPQPQSHMTEDRQINQFMYSNDPRVETEFQPSQAYVSQQVHQQPVSDSRPLYSNISLQNQQQQQQEEQKYPHFQQPNGTWPIQQGTNCGPNYHPSFHQQNAPLKGPPYPHSRDSHCYDNRQGYSSQNPRRPNFQQTPPQFSERPPPLSNQQGYQQDHGHSVHLPQEFNQQELRVVNQFPRRSLPSEPDMISHPPAHDRRKRLPLRRYYSEERDGSFQEEFERTSRYNSQTYENVPRDERGSPTHFHDQQMRYEKSRHRSSSLDSHHERTERYAKSRSCSLERNSLMVEEYEKENPRKVLLRTQSQGDEYVNEERCKFTQKGFTPSHGNTSTRYKTDSVGKAFRQDFEQDRHHTSSKEMKTATDSRQQTPKQRSQSSLPRNDHLKKTGNYCLQHKKFMPSTGTSTKQSSRRQLPKEPPLSQSDRRKPEKTFSAEKSSQKLHENAQQRAGILSTAARKSERGGNLKISFSEPISNLLNSQNKILSSTSDNRRESHLPNPDSLKQDKNFASNTNVVTAQHICPFTRESTNVILNQMPPLHRNQSLDSQSRGSHLSTSPNAQSYPIPMVTRTRSLDRYSSSDTNLNTSPYYHDNFSRPGSAPGLMYEPVHHQNNNSAALQLSLYEMHALKKEEKFWSDIYSALPADMKHLITNRGTHRNKHPMPPISQQNVEHPSSTTPLEHRFMQRGLAVKGSGKCPRDVANSSLGERIGNRLRMLHQMKEQSRVVFNRRKPTDAPLARRSASDGEYSFSSTTNFPLYWNLQRRPHSDSAIDLLERLEMPNSRPRISGSAYNSSEYLATNPGPRMVDKSQSYLTSPSTNIPPSPAPTQPIKLRDTALRGDRIECHPTVDNRAGFFSCLQNIESLTRQYQDDFLRDEDEIYSDSGIPHSDYARYDIHEGNRRKFCGPQIRRRNDHFDNV